MRSIVFLEIPYRLTLGRIPDDRWNKGNEMANLLAQEGVSNTLHGPEFFCGVDTIM